MRPFPHKDWSIIVSITLVASAVVSFLSLNSELRSPELSGTAAPRSRPETPATDSTPSESTAATELSIATGGPGSVPESSPFADPARRLGSAESLSWLLTDVPTST